MKIFSREEIAAKVLDEIVKGNFSVEIYQNFKVEPGVSICKVVVYLREDFDALQKGSLDLQKHKPD